MNFANFFDSQLVADLGWTLAHSIWQIALIAGGLVVGLRLLGSASANVRYAMAVTALCISAVVPLLTYFNFTSVHGADGFPSIAGSTESQSRLSPEQNAEASVSSSGTAAGAEAVSRTRSTSVDALRSAVTHRISPALPYGVGLWILGIVFFGLRLAGGFWQLHRYRREGARLPDGEWPRRIAVVTERLGLGRTIEILSSTLVDTPIAIGVLRPVILIPAAAFLQIVRVSSRL